MNRLVITMGDPCGVGPEIIVKFFDGIYKVEDKRLFLVVVGSKSVLEYYKKKLKIDLEIVEITKAHIVDGKLENGKLHLINIDTDIDKLEFGKHTELGGALSIKYLDKAIELCHGKYVDGIVTCPISKDSINMAGFKYSGHTEYLAEKSKTEDFAMVLKGKKVVVLLNSTHVSLKEAINRVTKESVLNKIRLAQKAKKELGLTGSIAVAGLNPHNGENGLFGTEEIEIIAPAVEEAQKEGIDCEGPIVPDSLFVKVVKGQYAISVVMYHDQGLIPMKMESFGMGVNVTIGLPFVRTSVDHGTAFDIVGKNLADIGSLREAINLGNECAKIRKADISRLAEVDYSN